MTGIYEADVFTYHPEYQDGDERRFDSCFNQHESLSYLRMWAAKELKNNPDATHAQIDNVDTDDYGELVITSVWSKEKR